MSVPAGSAESARSPDGPATDSAFDSLLHAVLNLRALPPETRAAWKALFEHLVFGPDGAVIDHIPPERHGVLALLMPAGAERLRSFLAGRLDKKG